MLANLRVRCQVENLAASSPAWAGTPRWPPMLACNVFSVEPRALNRSRSACRSRYPRHPARTVKVGSVRIRSREGILPDRCSPNLVGEPAYLDHAREGMVGTFNFGKINGADMCHV